MMVEGQVPGIWVHILNKVFLSSLFAQIFAINLSKLTTNYLASEKGYG